MAKINQRFNQLFNTLNTTRRQFAVIGLGRFGRAVCSALHGMGYEVLGIDVEEKLVANVICEQIATHAIQLDSTEASALKEAGIFEFDTVIIAIGNFLEESIITTLNVKEAGVAHVIAKASSETHGKLLRRVGADHVVFPEQEAGVTLARTLTKPTILDRFELDPDNSIVEVIVPKKFHEKTIAELHLRKNYGLNVIAVGQEDKFEVNPIADRLLQQGEIMVVIGSNQAIEKLPI